MSCMSSVAFLLSARSGALRPLLGQLQHGSAVGAVRFRRQRVLFPKLARQDQPEHQQQHQEPEHHQHHQEPEHHQQHQEPEHLLQQQQEPQHQEQQQLEQPWQEQHQQEQQYEPEPVRYQIGSSATASSAEVAAVREKRDAFKTALETTSDWKGVWALYSRLSRSGIRKHQRTLDLCHSKLLRRLDSSLRADDVKSGDMVSVLSSKEFLKLDRSVDMEIIVYEAMADRVNRADVADICYTLRKLGPLVNSANQAVHTSAHQCMLVYLQKLNTVRHLASPNDVVSAAYGCYKGNVQFGAIMTYTNMACLSHMSQLDVRAMQWLCTMAVDGFEQWSSWKKDSAGGKELIRALLQELQSRGDSVPVSPLVNMLAKMMSIEETFDEDILKKFDTMLSVRGLDVGVRTIYNLAILFSRSNYVGFKFDFVQRLSSLHSQLQPPMFHSIIAFLYRSKRISDRALCDALVHITYSLSQYSVDDMGSLGQLLSTPVLCERPEVAALAIELAAEVERRPLLTGTGCVPLLAFLTRYSHLEPRKLVKLAREACDAAPEASLAECSQLLYTLANAHTAYRAEAKQSGDKKKKTTAKEELKHAVDPRRRLKRMVTQMLPKTSFNAALMNDIHAHRLAMGSATLGIYWTSMLDAVGKFVIMNWLDLLTNNPHRTIETLTALSELNYGVPRLYQQVSKHLTNTCTPLQGNRSSVSATREVEYPELYYKIQPTSQWMIDVVWACAVQGVIPQPAVQALCQITPEQVRNLPQKRVMYLFQLYALAKQKQVEDGTVTFDMPRKTLDAVQSCTAHTSLSSAEKQFSKEMGEHLGMHGVRMARTGDGCSAANAMLLRDGRMVKWIPTLEQKLKISAKELNRVGFTPVAVLVDTPADRVFRSKRRLAVSTMQVRALCALGWKVIQVPHDEWADCNDKTERSRLLDSLPVQDGSEALETSRGIQYDLKGEIIPDIVEDQDDEDYELDDEGDKQ